MSQFRQRPGAPVARFADPSINAWLFAGGSLTARLRAHGGVEVVVVRQGVSGLWMTEQHDLNCRCGYARDVVLLLNGRVAVWARSVTSLLAFHGAWKSLAGLGTRPLAELLFQGRVLDRDALVPHRLARHDPVSRWAEQSTTAVGHAANAFE